MDLSVPYDKMQSLYNYLFSLKNFGNDISNKFALISLTCYTVHKLRQKNPDASYYNVLYKINNTGYNPVPDDQIKAIAVICEDFGYNCTEFPTFGIEEKQIPKKIKEILGYWLPF